METPGKDVFGAIWGRKEKKVLVEELADKVPIADVYDFDLCIFLPMAFSGP